MKNIQDMKNIIDEYTSLLNDKKDKTIDRFVANEIASNLDAINDIRSLLFDGALLNKENCSVCQVGSVAYTKLVELDLLNKVKENTSSSDSEQQEKKYLITSGYHYYDDFNFANVCICDTKGQAEKRIKEIEKIKAILYSIEGVILYSNDDSLKDVMVKNYYDNVPNFIRYGEFYYKCFLKTEDHKLFLEQYPDFEDNCITNSTNFFHFIELNIANTEVDTLKFCNHDEAVLAIEEIVYHKDEL